ncbi:MAG: citramalate synthase [Clostridia bacterium]|nr:citramalate synthase [Clostridia bacterium]
MSRMVEIFDSTLRDGAQGEGIAFSVEDKLHIAQLLDGLGAAYIEAGNPGSNPKDLEFFERAKRLTFKNAKLCAFGSTRRCGADAASDKNVRSLLDACTPVVCIFGKASELHVQRVLRTTPRENLAMIAETVAFFKEAGREVVFDAEHFFDGCLVNEHYAFAALDAAAQAGADTLCLCDTNGAAYPTGVFARTQQAVKRFGDRVAIHCHNDTGLAVANSLFAVDAGARQVQGTFIGFGERCGNANLSTLIADLQLKRGIGCIPAENMPMLTSAARALAEIANLSLPPAMPYVGASAFAHKGGMHIDGVSKLTCSFEHIDPEQVGNERRFLMSEVSGRTTLLAAVNRVDQALTKDSPQTKSIMQKIKELEHYGYQFEAAQSSVELLIRRQLGPYKPYFALAHYKIITEHPVHENIDCATAIIKLSVDGITEITAAQGDGPVHALDCALKKALVKFYPELAQVRLTDYKVRVMEPRDATAAKVRVLIESTDGVSSWSTVGVSTDIIEASWIALVDSIEYKLIAKQAVIA